ncbi:MAG: hypothetical protein WC769_01360 [Thermodesulfovibrionales bacterium]
MEKQRNKLTEFIIYFAILLVGLLIGATIGMRFGVRSALFARDLTAVATYSLYAETQYKNAKYPDAKKALLNFIKLLENTKGSADPMISESVLTFDKMQTYGRLARLSRNNGDDIEAKQFMVLAVEECKRTSWKDCSDTKVESILTELERRALLPDKPHDKQ